MSTIDTLIEDARVIVLQPGDMIVLEFPEGAMVSAAQAAEVKDRLKAHPALKDHDALVLGNGARIGAIRSASTPEGQDFGRR